MNETTRRVLIALWSMLGFIGLAALVFGASVWLRFTEFRDGDVVLDVAQTRGLEFGSRVSDSECLAEARKRITECGDFRCRYDEIEFVRGCLRTAAITNSFCESVPAVAHEESGRPWREQQCYRFPNQWKSCTDLYYQVQRECDTRRLAALVESSP